MAAPKDPIKYVEWKKKMSVVHKGHIVSLEIRKKISEKLKGRKSPMEGRHHSQISKDKISEANSGGKNFLWKGESVGYSTLYAWVRKKLGKPEKCEYCGTDGLRGFKIDWANKDHKYRRNLIDWIRLCKACHRKYDYEKFGKTN